jgi:hypothetical protein
MSLTKEQQVIDVPGIGEAASALRTGEIVPVAMV